MLAAELDLKLQLEAAWHKASKALQTDGEGWIKLTYEDPLNLLTANVTDSRRIIVECADPYPVHESKEIPQLKQRDFG